MTTRVTRIAEALFTAEPMSWDTAMRLARAAEVAYTKRGTPEPSPKLERIRQQRIAKPITEADWELRAQVLAMTGRKP